MAAETLADISTNLDALAIKKRGLELGLEWASANNPLDPAIETFEKMLRETQEKIQALEVVWVDTFLTEQSRSFCKQAFLPVQDLLYIISRRLIMK